MPVCVDVFVRGIVWSAAPPLWTSPVLSRRSLPGSLRAMTKRVTEACVRLLVYLANVLLFANVRRPVLAAQ